jgi:microcystin-dependent protein
MSDPYMSQIEAFAFGYAPQGWMLCAGQLLPVNQYQALFSLLGVTYGGDGMRTFQLPDLRSRFAVGAGQGTGLSDYVLGQTAGLENVTLVSANMPSTPHTHSISANNATTGGTNFPGGSVALGTGIGQNGTTVAIYSTANPTVGMGALANNAGGQPHPNLMPGLAINYCICINGLFPSRG